MTDNSATTSAIFRKWNQSEEPNGIIALFPDQPWGHREGMITSYEHVGQHGAADYPEVMRLTREATPEEFAALKRELEGYPFEYELRVVKNAR